MCEQRQRSRPHPDCRQKPARAKGRASVAEGDVQAANRKVLRLLQTAELCGRALRPPASENAKSMRFNFGVAAPLKHARHLPGVMQTANATKQGSAAPCWIKAHTFGLFH